MPTHLTIAYMTNRKNPRIQWFFDSLHRETGGDYTDIRLVVVDYHCPDDQRARLQAKSIHHPWPVHVPPKPTVWQGPHRLTSQDYFAASNARNTALCYAPDGWIAYVDDLSVLMPGWLAAVRAAIAGNYIALGAYMKVTNLVVKAGDVVSRDQFPPGIDSRWKAGSDHKAVPATGSWMFGCSLAAPVEAFLRINGWDEDCDSMGSEDYICGMMLEKAGYTFRYDRRMFTLESEEAHHEEKPFKRIIKKTPAPDASHAILNAVKGGRHVAPNYFGPEGLRGLRARILAGEPMPTTQIPQHDWRDGQPLSEM